MTVAMCRGCAQRKYDSSLIGPGWKQRELSIRPEWKVEIEAEAIIEK